jgi:NADPH-dependent 7-cyano-7-deazaguanine reductase QueF-like protein
MKNYEITKRNGNICFNEDAHVYFDITDPSKKFISVTTLIEKFGQPFNKEFWSAYKALEKLIPKDGWAIEKKSLLTNKKYDPAILDLYNISEDDFNREQQNILDSWDEENRKSCERGTKIHADLENSFYKKKKNIDISKYQIGGTFECRKDYTDLDLENAVYPEYLIHRVTPDGKLCIAGQIDLLVKKGNHITIGDWKGLPLDTEIPTLEGWSTMRDLKIGDTVFDKDGKQCKVIVKSEIHTNPCYKIHFSKDISIIADEEHRWLISFSTHPNTKYKGQLREVIMTTKELYEYLQYYNPKNQYQVPKIYLNKELDLSEQNLPIDPYVLGLWLGNGTADDGRITQELNAKSWEIIESKGFELSKNSEHNDEKAETRTIYGLRTLLQDNNLLNNKHIPNIYQRSSRSQRINLIRGLMDADGFYDKIHKTFIMSTNYYWQADGLIKVLSSLGIRAALNKVTRPGYNTILQVCYDVKFKTSQFNPFMCRNQEVECVEPKMNYYFIKNVEKTETVETQCIQVDSPSHTYLCTRYMLVTHNTNKKIETKSYFDVKNKKSVMMKFPLNNLQDCNYWHYCLQLSTYAWMIQKLNPDFIIDDLVLVHFDHNDVMTVYHLPYLKEEVQKMLAFYKKQAQLEESARKRKRIEY